MTRDSGLDGLTLAVWFTVLFLQVLGVGAEAYFATEYEARRKRRRSCVGDNVENESSRGAGDHFSRHGFSTENLRVLRNVAPSALRVRRLLLIVTRDIAWLIVEGTMQWMLYRGHKDQPIPSENVTVLEMLEAVPYVKMMLDIIFDNERGKIRVWTVWVFTGLWFVLTLANASFGWTQNFAQKTLYFRTYIIFEAFYLVLRVLSSAIKIVRIRKLRQKSRNKTGEEYRFWPESRILGLLQGYFDVVMMLLWFVYSTGYESESKAIFDITGSAAYFLIIQGQVIWWNNVVCEDVLARGRDEFDDAPV